MDNSDTDREYEKEERLWNEFKTHPNYSTASIKVLLALAWLLVLLCGAELMLIMISLTPRLFNLVGVHVTNFSAGILLDIIIFFTIFVTALLVAGEVDKIRWAHFKKFKELRSILDKDGN